MVIAARTALDIKQHLIPLTAVLCERAGATDALCCKLVRLVIDDVLPILRRCPPVPREIFELHSAVNALMDDMHIDEAIGRSTELESAVSDIDTRFLECLCLWLNQTHKRLSAFASDAPNCDEWSADDPIGTSVTSVFGACARMLEILVGSGVTVPYVYHQFCELVLQAWQPSLIGCKTTSARWLS